MTLQPDPESDDVWDDERIARLMERRRKMQSSEWLTDAMDDLDWREQYRLRRKVSTRRVQFAGSRGVINRNKNRGK